MRNVDISWLEQQPEPSHRVIHAQKMHPDCNICLVSCAEGAYIQVGIQNLHGLKEAVNDMESIIMHNNYIDELLLYKGMKTLNGMLGDWTLRTKSLCSTDRQGSDDGAKAFSSYVVVPCF